MFSWRPWSVASNQTLPLTHVSSGNTYCICVHTFVARSRHTLHKLHHNITFPKTASTTTYVPLHQANFERLIAPNRNIVHTCSSIELATWSLGPRDVHSRRGQRRRKWPRWTLLLKCAFIGVYYCLTAMTAKVCDAHHPWYHFALDMTRCDSGYCGHARHKPMITSKIARGDSVWRCIAGSEVTNTSNRKATSSKCLEWKL